MAAPMCSALLPYSSFPRSCGLRPAAERWTIYEIILHITDSEANSYIFAAAAFWQNPGHRAGIR